MGESQTGKTLILRKGFASEDDALDHPVRLVHWKRVWVEKSPLEDQPDNNVPPFPWSARWAGTLTYMQDANGKVFATLLGTQVRRDHVVAILCDLSDSKCNDHQERRRMDGRVEVRT